jgi:hypothetical protein
MDTVFLILHWKLSLNIVGQFPLSDMLIRSKFQNDVMRYEILYKIKA